MRHTGFARSLVAAVLWLALAPALALAQSTIAGVVRDTSGAVLPGVTVEAASPVLIEKTRTVVSDGEGRYAIVDIRPGTYSVTFTLPGFNTFMRDGVEVQTNVSVPINAEMKVGAVEETVTVSGASPVVDVQNTSKMQVMTRDLIDTIPSARNMQAIGALVPGIRLNAPDVGGAQQTEQTYMSTHGFGAVHNNVMLDGLPIQTALNDGAVQNYVDNSIVAEATYQTSGATADTAKGGVRLNMIPKDGGNTVHGSGFFSGTSDSWNLQGTNLDQDLINRGVKTGPRVDHLNDLNYAMGGPIVKDRLWYFGSVRQQGTYVQIPNTFHADGSAALEDAWIRSFVGRATWQATPRNKFAFTYQRNYKWKGHEISLGGQEGLPINVDVASTKRDPVLYYIGQAKWTSTISNKLLFETGYSVDILHYSNYYQDGIRQVRGTPGWYANASHLNTPAGGTLERTNAGQLEQLLTPNMYTAATALSYVTGSHTMKVGMQWGFGSNGYVADMNADLYQIYQGGQPRQVRVYNTPIERHPELNADLGIYAQDQWTINRVTLSYGIRYEYLNENIPEQDRVAGRFAPALHYDEINCETLPGMTCWHSWAPRAGVAYDLFGNGKTALKASVGKYMTPDVSAFSNQFNPAATLTDTRTWTDRDLLGRDLPTNGDDIAEDNEVPASSNPNYGKIQGRSLDPNFKREYNWQYSASVQHELRPGMAVSFNWFRRTLHNTSSTVNRAINPITDWSRITIINPIDGSPIPAYRINADKVSVTPDLFLTNSDPDLRRLSYHGFELGTSARLPRRTLLFAGWTFERTVDVDCTMSTNISNTLGGQGNVAGTLNDPNSLRFCDMSGKTYQELGLSPDVPFRHEFKVNGSVPLWYGFEVSGTFQSYPGQLKANTPFPAPDAPGLSWTITPGSTTYPSDCAFPGCSGVVLPNRGVSGDPAVILQLVAPARRYMPRWNQVDFALRRSFTFGNLHVQAQLEVFNAFNANTVLTEGTALSTRLNPFVPGTTPAVTAPNYTFSSDDAMSGGTPNSILSPRLVRIGAQIRF